MHTAFPPGGQLSQKQSLQLLIFDLGRNSSAVNLSRSGLNIWAAPPRTYQSLIARLVFLNDNFRYYDSPSGNGTMRETTPGESRANAHR